MRELETGEHAWEQVNRDMASVVTEARSEPRVVRLRRQIPPRRRPTYLLGGWSVGIGLVIGNAYVWGKLLGFF